MCRSVVWIPALLVGAMVYWTLALGFGGLSLLSVTSDCPTASQIAPRDSYQSIRVNLVDSLDSDRETWAPVTVDLVSDRDLPPQADNGDQGAGGQSQSARGGGQRLRRDDRGPGETAF